MGIEQMAIKSVEEPELCGDILERLTVLAEEAVGRSAAHPDVVAIFYGEDMGFNTSLMLSPAWMREWVVHRLKRIADACHRHGKPFLLHSCGQIDALILYIWAIISSTVIALLVGSGSRPKYLAANGNAAISAAARIVWSIM